MRGRKPIPNAIKRASGDGIHDSGHRKIGNEPQPEAGAPSCPDELTGEARKAWFKFVKELSPMGVATKADRAALTILCQAWARMQDAQKHIDKDGAVIVFNNGVEGPNPYCRVFNDAEKIVGKWLIEFGYTPSARSRINLPPKDEGDDDLVAQLERK